jgi:thiamine-phosphate pyrophosphorylase
MISQLQFISQQTKNFTHLESIAQACEAGIKWIQLRIKDETEESIYTTALQAKEICDQYGATLIINDYPAIAAAIHAAGVHLGKEDMPVSEARKIVGDKMMVGATANTFEDIEKHDQDGADYVGLGPFRFTATKKKLSPVLGLEGYTRILNQCRACNISIPIIAIGGIGLKDIPDIMQTGVHGIAVSSLIALAANKKQLVETIFQSLKTYQNSYVNYSQQNV